MSRIVSRYWQVSLFVILGLAFVTRFYRLHLPESYMFDEVYHAVTAKLIAKNDPRAFEWWHPAPEPNTAIDWLHPPVAKYTQALAMLVWGENSFGWRFSSALFGVGVIWLIFRLSYQLFADRRVSLLAALLASWDGLLLVQSRIAMNDIHVTFFILASLLFYAKFSTGKQWKHLYLSGLMAGLALASKWSGIFIIISLGLFDVVRLIKDFDHFLKVPIKNQTQRFLARKGVLLNLGRSCLSFVFIPLVVYVSSYWLMFAQGHDFKHFLELHRQIWSYQTNLEALHPYQSRPGEWFLNLRPVWYHVDYIDEKTIANVYAFGNPALFVFGAASVILTFVFLSMRFMAGFIAQSKFSFLSKLQIKSSSQLLLLLISYTLVWLPWSLSPRIMFFYHYTPAVPLLSIMLAFWLIKLKTFQYRHFAWGKYLFLLVIFLTGGCFLVWYPHWTALPMPKTFVEKVYFMLTSWK